MTTQTTGLLSVAVVVVLLLLPLPREVLSWAAPVHPPASVKCMRQEGSNHVRHHYRDEKDVNSPTRIEKTMSLLSLT